MSLIKTSKARCKDCYKCIRHCPVKAIALKDGQARVVEEKCIQCGRCINICPQKAKSTFSWIEKFQQILADEDPVVVSIAPSYLAVLDKVSPWQLIAALKKIGVDAVEETAVGAEIIAKEYKKIFSDSRKRGPVITSCCPVIVNMIKIIYPDLLDMLSNLISPMQAHARMIKAWHGENTRVVFIGPCFAKKEEIADAEKNSVDIVLTFEEVLNFLNETGLIPEQMPAEYPDNPSIGARTYPLTGGVFKTAGITGSKESKVISVSGVEECLETFQDLKEGLINPAFIEAMACRGGCINGPAVPGNKGRFARQEKLYEYLNDGYILDKSDAKGTAEQAGKEGWELELAGSLELTRTYSPAGVEEEMPSEEEIRKVLALTGKNTPEDETNCGGCGYPSCREKAIAVCRGLAEPEMCIPYMREKAESFSNIIVESTVNAIIVVDKEMFIQDFNPAAYRMFNRKKETARGKHLSAFIDPVDFKEVWETQRMKIVPRRAYEQYGLITRQIIYPLPRYETVVGIIIDITREEKVKAEKARMKQEALSRASRVIKEQMRVVQEVAGLLGESTAETKATLLELIDIMDEDDKAESEGGSNDSEG